VTGDLFALVDVLHVTVSSGVFGWSSAVVVGITISLLARHVVAFICTTRFDIQKFCVLPTQCRYMFLWISEQTAIISVRNIN
jgi:hypothetical protein